MSLTIPFIRKETDIHVAFDRFEFTLDSNLEKEYTTGISKYDTIYLEKPEALNQDLLVYVNGSPRPIANLRYTRVIKTIRFYKLKFVWNKSTNIPVSIVLGNPETFIPQPQVLISTPVFEKQGVSIWDWPSTITVPANTSVTANVGWDDAGGLDVFYKSGVSGYVEAVTIVTDNVGQPMLWLFIDDWDVLAMGFWGVTHQYGVYDIIIPQIIGGDHPPRYKCEYLPRKEIYFENSVGIKFSNTTGSDHYCYFVLIQLRFINPPIIGRPKNEISTYNDISEDHVR